MKETKLWTLTVNMDKYERSRFRKFLLSPYFNQNRHLTALFDLLIEMQKRDVNLTKVHVWREVCPDLGPFNDNKFRRLSADLVQLIKQFFSQRVLEQKPAIWNQAFLEAVLEKKMRPLFATAERDGQLTIQKNTARNAQYHFERYAYESRKSQIHRFNHQRKAPENIGELSHHLDQFYLGEKLKYYCEVLSWQRVTSRKFDFGFMPQIMEYVGSLGDSKEPIIAMYYQMVLTITESGEAAHYFKLKELLQQYSSLFPKKEARNMYAVAQNFCTSRINKGQREYLNETFELHQMLLDEAILLTDNEISPWDYKNLVVVGLRLGEFDWTYNFIQEYKNNLSERFRENAFTYNLSKYYFYKKEYEKVIPMLQQVEYQDVFYNLDSRAMLLKTYYELDEWEAMDALMESFKALLRRKKVISEHHRKNYMNFIRMLKKLSRSYPFSDADLDLLKAEIQDSTAMADTNWLLAKVESLRTGQAFA